MTAENEKVVHLVHAIDAEGPLAETEYSLNLETQPDNDWPTNPAFDLSPTAFEAMVQKHRQRVLGTWPELVSMLRTATSPAQRNALPDSYGRGWIFNWFCMDHIGFVENPRYRMMGVHKIFDFYEKIINEQKAGDALHWHFHPMSTYRQANICATSYVNSPELYEILTRRLIDRHWFPCVNRAGFQDERPDSHWFLEQWIPFDLSNTSSSDVDIQTNPDLSLGRFTDWRWATREWEVYQPHHDCYQTKGACRRRIGRCLNLINRFANITAEEMRAAFSRAQEGLPTLVGFSSHDWRDLNLEMAYIRHLLQMVAPDFPEVKYRYSEAADAFNRVSATKPNEPLSLDCQMQFGDDRLPKILVVRQKRGQIFGPQPFLAIRTRSQRYIHDNFNFHDSLDSFNYQFDHQSVLPRDVEAIGVGANDAWGRQSIHVLEIDQVKRPKKNEVYQF
jgi:hypothetical protein